MKEKYHHRQLGHDDELGKPLEPIWVRKAKRGGRLGEPQLSTPPCFGFASDECQAERQKGAKRVEEDAREKGGDDKKGIHVWPDPVVSSLEV